MKVLYFGSYNPEYSRNRVLINGLRQNGIEVIECRDNSQGLKKLFKLAGKHWKLRNEYDVMVVGFPGHELMFLARLLTRKPIIFDAFTSHYGGYVLDRKLVSLSSARALYYRFLDHWSCRLADLVLLDTQAHINFFVREFGLPQKKFQRIFVGTDEKVFSPKLKPAGLSQFIVHFHGNFIPLQGIECIVKAASLLKDDNIHFNIIGRGQTYGDVRKIAQELKIKNVLFIDPVPYEKLSDFMAMADICLGIFGSTPKTLLVIPNKVFEALAMAKPVITADTPAIRELLTDKENCVLVPAANPQALAEAIRNLKNSEDKSERIGKNGYELLQSKLTTGQIGLELKRLLESFHAK